MVDEKIIQELKEKVLSNYKPERIILFGSGASLKNKTPNDIDLCIIKDKIKNKSNEYIKIRNIIGETVLPLDILFFTKDEFLRRKDIRGTVQYEIDKKGKVLYESK